VNFKPPFFSVLAPTVSGVLLFLLFVFFTRAGVSFNLKNQNTQPDFDAGCAVLIVDESQDDRRIRETLALGGLGDFISESSQLVPIDDFGALKFVPLDSFHSEIEAFDPRDTGYAAKLRVFFVHEGKRFFFRPLERDLRITPANMRKHLDSLLESTPFIFLVLGQKDYFLLYFALLTAAFFLALFFSRAKRLFIYQLPVLLAIACLGFYAIILAAILTGIWELLREPLGELFAARRYERRQGDYAGLGFRGAIERLRPFRANLLLVLLFLFFMTWFLAARISPFLLAVVFVSFALFYFFSFMAETERARKTRHIRFIPVLLLPREVKTFSFFPFLLPFGVIALISLFLPRSLPEGNVSLLDPVYFVSREEYEKHMAFQSSFSYRSMNHEFNSGALNEAEYLLYYLGDDGLIAGDVPFNNPEGGGVPQFSLETLMDFLVEYNKHFTGGSSEQKEKRNAPLVFELMELISVTIIFALCLLDFLRPGIAPKKKEPFVGDKRIAA